MKKLNILLVISIISVLLLSSCSKVISSNKIVQDTTIISSNTEINNPDLTDNNYSDEIKPSSIVKLSYLVKSKKLFAKIYTTWNNAEENSLYLEWKAPKNTYCYSSSFPIKKYNNINDYTTAYINPFYKNKICQGVWKVIILNKNNNYILSKDSYLLK